MPYALDVAECQKPAAIEAFDLADYTVSDFIDAREPKLFPLVPTIIAAQFYSLVQVMHQLFVWGVSDYVIHDRQLRQYFQAIAQNEPTIADDLLATDHPAMTSTS
jgi:hypothetical protein